MVSIPFFKPFNSRRFVNIFDFQVANAAFRLVFLPVLFNVKSLHCQRFSFSFTDLISTALYTNNNTFNNITIIIK